MEIGRFTTVFLFFVFLISHTSASGLYSTDFEGSDSGWGCHSPDKEPDICTTDASDHYSSPDESLKAHNEDGLCGVAGGVARDFNFALQPDTLRMQVKARADDWGSTSIYLKDSSGYHKLWEKYAHGSSYSTGWTKKEFDISSYDEDFKIIVGNNDDSAENCDNGDHGWWIWADDIEIRSEDGLMSEKYSYRVEHQPEIDYSGMIVSRGESRTFLLEVSNGWSGEKEVVTYLEGVKARFNENGESSIEYSISKYGVREFLVTLEPEKVDRDAELRFVTENTKIGVNTTDIVPVTVRNHPQVSRTREVPGITGVQLFSMLVLSVLLYYRRL